MQWFRSTHTLSCQKAVSGIWVQITCCCVSHGKPKGQRLCTGVTDPVNWAPVSIDCLFLFCNFLCSGVCKLLTQSFKCQCVTCLCYRHKWYLNLCGLLRRSMLLLFQATGEEKQKPLNYIELTEPKPYQVNVISRHSNNLKHPLNTLAIKQNTSTHIAMC